MFPYILNTGYATTSGIHMLMPVEERANKTRHILKMNGMRLTPYWLALFCADFILFLIPTTLLAILVAVTDLTIFSDHLIQFIVGMLGFGTAKIAESYFLSTFFNTQDAAIKGNIYIQLLVGTFLPFVLMGFFSDGSTQNS